jgi:hypothetical protein
MIKSFVDMGVQVRHAGHDRDEPDRHAGSLKPPFSDLAMTSGRYPAVPGLPAVRRVR